MIEYKLKGPLEVIKDEHSTKHMYAELGKGLFESIPKETPIVIEVKEEYFNDRDTPYMVREMRCKITSVQNEYVSVPHFKEIPALVDERKSRWLRFKQLIKGQ